MGCLELASDVEFITYQAFKELSLIHDVLYDEFSAVSMLWFRAELYRDMGHERMPTKWEIKEWM